MERILIIIVFWSLYVPALAQTGNGNPIGVSTGSNNNVLDQLQLLDINYAKRGTLTYEEIEGTPYIDNFSGADNNLPLGKLYTADMTYITTALVRYNAYTDDMEVSLLEDGVDYYLLKKQPDFLYVVLKDKKYRAFQYQEVSSFFVILSEDDTQACTLLKKEKVVFVKAEKPKSSFVTATAASFKRLRDTYFLKLGDKLYEVPKKKKLFYALFEGKEEAVKAYMNANQLKHTREKDLLQLARHYNNL
ncbi:MAG: hypothetical protein DWP94_00885 [Flavobacterium sp.]|nr:MAG: hypothetical protein DWP94_00885 [Flavobacterium sp.]